VGLKTSFLEVAVRILKIMQINAVIEICPECKKLTVFLGDSTVFFLFFLFLGVLTSVTIM
jgi:hypothetical protein